MTNDDRQPDASDPSPLLAGCLAEFETPDALKSAAEHVRDAGYTRWDVHSPYPIHGIDRAMGIRPTVLPWLVLGAGLTGGAVALLMQWYLNATSYPFLIRGYAHIISGKPLFSLPANIPVTFELIVLFSALTAFAGMLILNRLPQFTHSVFSSPRFPRATSDGFLLSIDAADPKFDASRTQPWLESLGATAVEACYQPTRRPTFPRVLTWSLLVLAVLAVVPPLLVAHARLVHSDRPRIHIISDMDFQPKYKAQTRSAFFADGRAMRMPVPGTVARGNLEKDSHFYRGKVGDRWATTFPKPVSEAMMKRGHERFNIYCAVCHGRAGDGQGMTAIRALKRMEPNWATPVALFSPSVREQPVGQIFNTITHGIRKMPAYGPQIPTEDRWAIVLYVRALQRSQHTGIEDVPDDKRPFLR